MINRLRALTVESRPNARSYGSCKQSSGRTKNKSKRNGTNSMPCTEVKNTDWTQLRKGSGLEGMQMETRPTEMQRKEGKERATKRYNPRVMGMPSGEERKKQKKYLK